jgi:hypothetical protein
LLQQLANNGLKKGKGNGGHYQYTHVQLEREGIILETQGIPEQRRNNIYYIFSSNDPGIYNIKMYYKGKSDPIYERNMQLEDLLEMQNQSDPVSTRVHNTHLRPAKCIAHFDEINDSLLANLAY